MSLGGLSQLEPPLEEPLETHISGLQARLVLAVASASVVELLTSVLLQTVSFDDDDDDDDDANQNANKHIWKP